MDGQLVILKEIYISLYVEYVIKKYALVDDFSYISLF